MRPNRPLPMLPSQTCRYAATRTMPQRSSRLETLPPDGNNATGRPAGSFLMQLDTRVAPPGLDSSMRSLVLTCPSPANALSVTTQHASNSSTGPRRREAVQRDELVKHQWPLAESLL